MSLTAHGFLREHREEIVREWEFLLSQAHAAGRGGSVLRNELPELLSELADWLASGARPGEGALGAAALKDVVDRLNDAQGLDQLLRERRLLHETITHQFLHDAGLAETDCVSELVRLNAALDQAFTEVIRAFVEERDRRARHASELERHEQFRGRLADALRPLGSPPAVQAAGARVLGEWLAATRVHYAEVGEDGHVGAVSAEYHAAGVPALAGGIHFDVYGQAALAELRAGRTLVVEDVRSDPRLSAEDRARAAALGIRAYVILPLVKGNKPVAVLVVHQAFPRPFSAAEIGLIVKTGEWTWAAVERARAELALRERELRFRALVTATSEVIYSMSPDWSEMRFLQGREFIADTAAPSSSWLDKYIYRDDQPRVLAVIHEAIRTSSIFELEHRVRRADGSVGWTFSRAVPLQDETGAVVEWFGAASDITVRKRLEEERDRFFELSVTILAIGNTAGQFQRVNPATTAMLGWTREELLARPFLELVHPEDLDQTLAVLEALATGKPAFGFEHRLRCKDGSYKCISWNIAASPLEGVMYCVGLDMTERRAADEREERLARQLAAERAQFETILNELPVAVIVRDIATGRRLVQNRAATRLLGLDASTDLIMTAPGELSPRHPDGRPYEARDLPAARAIRGEPTIGEELVVRRRDGTDVTLQVTADRLSLSDGPAVVSAALDVTAERHASQLFRGLIENLPELAWTARPDGHVDYYNRRWYEYTGRSPAEMRGWGWEKVLDPTVLPVVRERWRHSLATGEPFEMEFPVRGADGRYRWFLTRVVPLRDAQGNIVRWFGVNTNVDTAKRAEQERTRLLAALDEERAKLRDLIMQSPTGVIVYEGPDFRFSLVNDNYKKMLGRNHLEGRLFLEVFPEMRGQPAAVALADTYRTGEPHDLDEHVSAVRSPQGHLEERYFKTSFRAIRGEGGVVSGVMAVGIEVTEQVLARRQLEASLHFAQQFVGILGHDLRTPLTAISAAAELLQRRNPRPADAAKLARIAQSAARMSRMVDQLLDLTRSRLGGGIKIERRHVDLAEVVQGVVEELRLAFPGRTILYTIERETTGEWDPDRLAQVVSNLVGNALKYGDPAAPIEVQLHRFDEEVRLDVRNQGPPIPAEMLSVIFEPYRRGTARGAANGLGLGLFISKQIVLAHSGTIDVRSTAKEGTVFSVTLPRHEAREEEAAPDSRAAEQGELGAHP